MSESPLVTFRELAASYNPEVKKVTLWRHERDGLFPRRVKLSPRRVAWRRDELEEWRADPQGWIKRHQAKSAPQNHA
ncbi:MAG: AlpA family phage regulatory protein [Xanthobacteraceae bacterium]|nr:AlpA family phage regulatory protein [Xanthobacteraceae bacterium]